MNLRPIRVLTALTFGLALSLVFPNFAPGAPIDDLRSKAKALTDQLDANGAKIAALGEQFDGAQLKFDQAQAKIDDAQARIKAAEEQTNELKSLLDLRAASIYKSASNSAPIDAINTKRANDLTTRSKYSDVAASHDDALIDRLAAAKADLGQQKSEAERLREQAAQERDALAKAKADVEAANAEQNKLLGQVKGQIADFVRQEQQRRQAAAASAAPRGNRNWSGPVPNPAGGAGAAVAFANAQVGKPYCYGGAGPDCYDCSGLTMRAWQAGGLSLPHYSGAQGRMFPRVPLDQLQPGDLITTSNWDAHVGIWVGGGYVHATHTGDFIRFVPGSGSVVDAVRPG